MAIALLSVIIECQYCPRYSSGLKYALVNIIQRQKCEREKKKCLNMKTAKPWQKQNEHYNSITKRLLHELHTVFFFGINVSVFAECIVFSIFGLLIFQYPVRVKRPHFSEKVIIGYDSFFMNEKFNVKYAVHIFETWHQKKNVYVAESTNQGLYHSTMKK